MIEKILDLSVRNRWFVVLVTGVACALGVWSLLKLPIDAVPDVTNNQVQINAIAPALDAGRDGKAGDLPDREHPGGHADARVHKIVLAQRFRPGDGGLQRQDRCLLRAAAGE